MDFKYFNSKEHRLSLALQLELLGVISRYVESSGCGKQVVADAVDNLNFALFDDD